MPLDEQDLWNDHEMQEAIEESPKWVAFFLPGIMLSGALGFGIYFLVQWLSH